LTNLGNALNKYKAKEVLGVLIFVDPKKRTHQGNALILNVSILTKEIEIEIEKQETSSFQCLQCGCTAMADYVGAINIRLKAKIMMAATVNQPIGETLISTYKPSILIGGS
jgi:hypothetical protein